MVWVLMFLERSAAEVKQRGSVPFGHQIDAPVVNSRELLFQTLRKELADGLERFALVEGTVAVPGIGERLQCRFRSRFLQRFS